MQYIVNNNTYCEYIFDRFPDNRLDFSSREVLNNTIKLTEKISWEFSKPCHTLICGSTSSGKTYLVSMLILDYLRIKGKGGGFDIYVCGPKSADLAIICRRIDLKKYGKVQNLAVSDNEIARLLREVNSEAEKVFSTFDLNDYYDRFAFTLIYTLFMTGLRIGEAQALQWEDIDFVEKILEVNKNMYYKTSNEFYITEPKTLASNRVIALDDTTLQYLSEWKVIQRKIL